MKQFEQFKSFSWCILKAKYAIKVVDKSFVQYGETVIPIDVRKYFEVENCVNGDKVDIVLRYNKKQYKSQIIFENNFNRSKLIINKQLVNIISNKINEFNFTIEEKCLKAIFLKESKSQYLIKVVVEI